MEFLEENIRFHLLHWVRCVSMVGPLPIFGSGQTGRLARVALGVLLGSLMALIGDLEGFTDPGFSLLLAGYVVKEALLGFLLAFLANLTFAVMRIAGHMIGSEMGFNMANIQDPVTGVNTQLMAHLFEAIGLAVFFITGGHLTLMRALARSFEAYPVTRFTLDPELVRAVILFSSGIFLSGLQVAAPVFCSMIVVAVALAILSKVAPQLQIMQFAFPMKILAGLLLIIATLGAMIPAMGTVFENLEVFLFEMLSG